MPEWYALQVNNPGEPRRKNIYTAEIEDLDVCYETNLKSVFMMTKLSLPYLAKTKGKSATPPRIIRLQISIECRVFNGSTHIHVYKGDVCDIHRKS